jgi:predicted O-linked N-acetylglucosamine transferase (SPINDLY family)
VASYQQALRLYPDYPEAHNSLGAVLHAQGKTEEAVACYQQALRLKPNYAEAHTNLGVALQAQGKLEEAATSYEQALRLRPSPALRIRRATLLPPIYASVADISTWRTRLHDNLTQLHRDHVTHDLTHEQAHPLFYLAYQGLNDRDLQRQVARLYQAPPPSHDRRGRPSGTDRRVRVGFISRHLREHTIGHLFRGLIAQLDRSALAVSVFALGRFQDSTTHFLRRQAEAYVELSAHLPTARQQLADHALDVLIYTDLGMEELSYSLAFSRLAPVQCVLWGHPVTTGIDTLDYFLSSALLDVADAQQHYTETLVRLPALPVYYYRPQPPDPLPGRAALGLPADGHLYGCPQSLFKLHPEFDPLLKEILRRDPSGVLVLLEGKHAWWTEALRRRFAMTLGETTERVRWLGPLSRSAFLNLNALVDVLLDPIHFGGGNTSYEGLAVGVPIVTLPSGYLRGRITAALYEQMQLRDCVAADAEEYIATAVRLGSDPEYRRHIRGKILEASDVLYENVAGVRALEAFLLAVVRSA